MSRKLWAEFRAGSDLGGIGEPDVTGGREEELRCRVSEQSSFNGKVFITESWDTFRRTSDIHTEDDERVVYLVVER